MERTTERGDDWVKTQRKVNYDKGTAEVERETSGGASSSTQRQYDSETGTLSSEGSITGKDGSRVFDIRRADPGRWFHHHHR